MIKVLIADDQELIRESLKIVLGANEDMEVTGIAENGEEVLSQIKKEKPDVILMDIRMPGIDGVECTRLVKEKYPNIYIIVLTTFDDDEYIFGALKYGASGYLLKGISMKNLAEAIRTVVSGKAMINPDITDKVVKLFNHMAQGSYSIQVDNALTEELTKTEWKVIQKIGCGMSNKEIASELALSEGTIRNYLSSVLSKLELRDEHSLPSGQCRPVRSTDTYRSKTMGDIKLKKGTGILFIMAVLFISSLLYLRYWDQDVLRVGIFYGSNWEVPGTVHYEILDKAIKKFKSKYPNIKVEYEKGILSDDYSEWLSEQILKGEEPDVYLVLDEDFHTLASLGALKNLDGVINVDKEFKKEEFYSSVYKAGQYGGSQYALPMECNPTLMFVNKTLLQKEGIKVPDNDWTWDDFYRICEKMAKDSDGDGQIEQFGYYDYTWLQAVYSNGISPFNKKGTSSNFLDERFSQSLEFVKRLEETNRNYQVTSNDFDLGKVAFRPFTFSDYRTYMPYPWRIKKYSSFEWTCIRMPAGPSGDNRSEMSALMAGMSSRTGKKQAAWDFIKMLTTDEDIQRLIYEDTSAASVLKSVNTSKSTMNLLNKDTPGDSIIDMSLLDTVIDTGVIPYRFKDYTEAYEKTDNLIKGYVNEKDDSSTFLFQMKNQIDEILKK